VTRVRLPRLLNADLTERARLLPTSYAPTIALRETGTAQMTIPDTAPAVAMHDWLELYTQRGTIGYWRVTNIARTAQHEITLTLRHAIDSLSDSLWRAQLDYDGTVAGYLAALLAWQTDGRWQLGACETDAAYKRAGINYDRLSDLLWEMVDSLPGYRLAYDLSTTPWTLSLVAMQAQTRGELRLSRNIENIQITRDDADMCNRLHLSINTQTTTAGVTTNTVELRTYEDAVSIARYGVIERTADIDTVNVADPDAWARDLIARRAEPSVQISVEGYELSRQTGEAWDEMDVGRLVRAALTDMGELLTERVERVTYPDALGEPERVTVELANRLPRFSATLAGLRDETARLGGAARGAARSAASAGQLKTWSIVTQDLKEAQDGTGLTQLYESGIVVDAQAGVTIYSLGQGFQSERAELNVTRQGLASEVQRATQAETGLSTDVSRVEQKADSITAEVVAARDGEPSLSSRLSIMAGNITAATGRITDLEDGVSEIEGSALWAARNGLAAINGKLVVDTTGNLVVTNGAGLYVYHEDSANPGQYASFGVYDANTLTGGLMVSKINGQTSAVINADRVDLTAVNARLSVAEGQISTKVSAGDIASEINQTAQSVLIQASKIDLQGYVTATDLAATNAQITNLTTGVTTATELKSVSLKCYDLSGFSGSGITFESWPVSWKTKTVLSSVSVTFPTLGMSMAHDFLWDGGSTNGRIIMSDSPGSVTPTYTTIYYLGADSAPS